jgi:hypothetical protein
MSCDHWSLGESLPSACRRGTCQRDRWAGAVWAVGTHSTRNAAGSAGLMSGGTATGHFLTVWVANMMWRVKIAFVQMQRIEQALYMLMKKRVREAKHMRELWDRTEDKRAFRVCTGCRMVDQDGSLRSRHTFFRV